MENNNNSEMENELNAEQTVHAKKAKGEKKKAAKKKRGIILGTVAGVIVLTIIYFWVTAMGHEKTDNAQIDAMITPVRNIVPGFVTNLKFTDNQVVKKGDVLIEIDNADYKAKVAQAEAALESAQAQLEIAKSGTTTAELNANASSLNSQAAKFNIITAQARVTKNEKEMSRIEKMMKDKAATQQQYEAISAEFETSKAQLEMLKKQYDASSSQATGAQSQVGSQRSQITLATAMVKQRTAELQMAQTQLDNTIIKAPFNGIISKKSIEIGQYLQAGTPICSAVDYEHLWVSANFKETQIAEMKLNQDVDIKIDAFPSVKIKGKLQSFGGATGAKFSLLPPDNSTGNFVKISQRVPVRIMITDYPKEMASHLIPGLSAMVDIHTN